MVHPVRLKIQGSCVTRDAVGSVLDKVAIDSYRARSCIVSHVSDPVDVWFKDQSELPNFERRNVYEDFSKKWRFDNCESIPTVYDFIDERFGILRMRGGRWVTFSTSLQAMAGGRRPLLKKGKWMSPNSDEFVELTLANLDRFCGLVEERGPALVNTCYWAATDENGMVYAETENGFTDRMNGLLDKIYDRLATRTNAVFFGLPKSDFVGQSAHRWGRAPYHYSPELESVLGDKLVSSLLD